MIYRIESTIFENYPDFYRGVVVALDRDNSAPFDAALDQLFRQWIQEVELDESIKEAHPRIKAWSEIYKTFPLKEAGKIRPSVASLVGRVKMGEGTIFHSFLHSYVYPT